MYNNKDLDAIEENELRLQRIRKKLVTFKDLVKPIIKAQSMNYEQFLHLSLAAAISDDYNDSLLLNKLTILYPVPSIN